MIVDIPDLRIKDNHLTSSELLLMGGLNYTRRGFHLLIPLEFILHARRFISFRFSKRKTKGLFWFPTQNQISSIVRLWETNVPEATAMWTQQGKSKNNIYNKACSVSTLYDTHTYGTYTKTKCPAEIDLHFHSHEGRSVCVGGRGGQENRVRVPREIWSTVLPLKRVALCLIRNQHGSCYNNSFILVIQPWPCWSTTLEGSVEEIDPRTYSL